MANFDIAVGQVLENEGGYVNNPNDPGGETKYGITKRQYPDLDLKNLALDQAKEIYRRNYWHFDNIQDQLIANKLLDMCVNMGVGTAIRLVQTAVQVAADGKYGTQTEAAINKAYQQPKSCNHCVLSRWFIIWILSTKTLSWPYSKAVG